MYQLVQFTPFDVSYLAQSPAFQGAVCPQDLPLCIDETDKLGQGIYGYFPFLFGSFDFLEHFNMNPLCLLSMLITRTRV
jgi:hypothetical protein